MTMKEFINRISGKEERALRKRVEELAQKLQYSQEVAKTWCNVAINRYSKTNEGERKDV